MNEVDVRNVKSSWNKAIENAEIFWRAKGLRAETLRHYLSIITRFFGWQETSLGFIVEPTALKPEMLISFSRTCGASENSRRMVYNTLRCFLRVCWQNGDIPYVPATSVTAFKEVRTRRQVLTEDELSRIASYLYDRTNPPRHIYRQRVFFELLISSAPRVEEICKLRWTDVDYDRNVISFFQKGGSLREVLLTERLRKALNEWRERSTSSRFIFRSVEMDKNCDNRPSRETMQLIVKDWFKKCEIVRESYAGSHLFRHTLATRAYELTNDIEQVRQLLGHTSSATTLRYVHIKTTAISELSRKLSHDFRKPKLVDARPPKAAGDGDGRDEDIS